MQPVGTAKNRSPGTCHHSDRLADFAGGAGATVRQGGERRKGREGGEEEEGKGREQRQPTRQKLKAPLCELACSGFQRSALGASKIKICAL